jgi:CheY-like chemotaxis protein
MQSCEVLIVDDESAILELMTTLFERQGYRVTTAESAAQAITLLHSHRFNVVLTDLRMESPFAGFEVVRAARHLQTTPFIGIVTAYPVPASDWKEAGADALFQKGTDTFHLPEKIATLLKLGPQAETSLAQHEHAIR